MIRRYFILLLICGCCKTNTPPLNQLVWINVRNFGAVGDGVVDDTKAFELAMIKADSARLPVYVPIGIYKARVQLSHDGLAIIGEQQPNAEVTTGSIILGLIDCNYKKNVTIENIGIDSRNQLKVTDDAALISGVNSDTLVLHQQFRNISIMGDGYMAYKHGILCQSGSDIIIRNVTVSSFFHGIAIRSSNVNIDSVYANYCGFTSVVVKSDIGNNQHTENVSVNHVTINGDTSNPYNRGGMVLVISYGGSASRTNNITVQNVNSKYGGEACVSVQQVKGIVTDVSISNCFSEGQGDSPSRACYDVSGGNNINFYNCTANNSLGYGFRLTNNATNVKVVNCFEKNSNIGAWTGAFTYLQLNGLEIIK